MHSSWHGRTDAQTEDGRYRSLLVSMYAREGGRAGGRTDRRVHSAQRKGKTTLAVTATCVQVTAATSGPQTD